MEDFTVIDVDRGDHYPHVAYSVCVCCVGDCHTRCQPPCGCAHPHHWQPDIDRLPDREARR